jgi:hypothetical protein
MEFIYIGKLYRSILKDMKPYHIEQKDLYRIDLKGRLNRVYEKI